MSRRSLLVCGLLCVSSLGWGSEAGDWLTSAVKAPQKGNTQWMVVFTTGHFGRDPQLANATRMLAMDMLWGAASPGDKVVFASAEMSIWSRSAPVDPMEMENELPRAPAPGSKGGADIEAILAKASKLAEGPIVVLSPGASQEPKGGGKLMGGDGSVPGFTPPIRKRFVVDTPSGARQVTATLLTRDGLFQGTAPRTDWPNGQAPQVVYDRPAAPSSAEKPSSNATPPWLFVVVGIVTGTAAGYFASLARRGPAVAEASQTPVDDTELQAWKAEAKSLQKKLDMIAQDLAAAADQTTGSSDEEKIELRQELLRKAKAISVWDETAMDFLDGIDRAMESASPERQAALQHTVSQFSRFAQRAGLDAIAPEVGEQVLDGFYRIDEVIPATAEFPADTVVRLISRGFRRGDQVLRQARIVMAKD